MVGGGLAGGWEHQPQPLSLSSVYEGNNLRCFCLSVQVKSFEPLQNFIFGMPIHFTTGPSASSFSIKVIGSRSNENAIFFLTFTCNIFYFTEACLKGFGHLKVKVTQYYGQMKRNRYYINC